MNTTTLHTCDITRISDFVRLVLTDDYGNEVVLTSPKPNVVDDFGTIAYVAMGTSFNTVDSRWAEAGDSHI